MTSFPALCAWWNDIISMSSCFGYWVESWILRWYRNPLEKLVATWLKDKMPAKSGEKLLVLVVCLGQWDILLRGICSEMKPKSKHTTNDGEPTLPPKLWQKKTVGGNSPVFFCWFNFCRFSTRVFLGGSCRGCSRPEVRMCDGWWQYIQTCAASSPCCMVL